MNPRHNVFAKSFAIFFLLMPCMVSHRVCYAADHPNALSPERIAALPAAQQAAWQQYYDRSAAKLRAEKEVLNAEVKANGLAKPIAAPVGPVFKVSSGLAASWYGSEEVRRLADSIISFQTPSGGWSKAVAYDKGPRQPGMHWTTHSDSWYYVGTFDNRATTEQLIFLAKAFTATKEPKYSAAFLKGLDYVFDAQFPNGGWPQVYPLAGDYHDEITFNDDLMVHVLNLLREVAENKPEYSFVDDARRTKARDAVNAGVQCILKTQIIQNGLRTVWCAQHDLLTLAPAAARKFEPASLSGGESLGIVRFLMDVEQPSAEVRVAIEGAVAWFEAVKITGVEVVSKPNAAGGNGVEVIANPTAPPMWARFYELGTNRPIFIGRDAVIRYNLAEIDRERAKGYSWYVKTPKDLLEKDYPKWRAKWGASTPAPA
jgi:PelA/Pel-15E family pectate lyase